jgi:NADH-quinone oxidoreductase subunit C
MTNEAIKEPIIAMLPAATFDETGEWPSITIDAADWRRTAQWLRGAPLDMDFLFCLTCIDWKTHLAVVYHFTSTKHRRTLVFKANLNRELPQIETVCDIWRTAEFHEREVYDLFGVQFSNHPDLRRLVLTDDFEGFPLRKDFEDPVNMIKL